MCIMQWPACGASEQGNPRRKENKETASLSQRAHADFDLGQVERKNYATPTLVDGGTEEDRKTCRHLEGHINTYIKHIREGRNYVWGNKHTLDNYKYWKHSEPNKNICWKNSEHIEHCTLEGSHWTQEWNQMFSNVCDTTPLFADGGAGNKKGPSRQMPAAADNKQMLKWYRSPSHRST